MSRSSIAAFALLWGLGSAVLAAPGGPVRPNVLLVCVDDLKPLLRCYGAAAVKSPNIDRLAARGLLFERAYCNQAVCSPSRNALMTGLRPQSLGIYDLGTNFRKSVPAAVTLAQHFRQNGYRTEAMGKVFHVGHGNVEDDASWTVPHWRPKAPGYAIPENMEPVRQRLAEAKAEGVPQSKWPSLAKGPPTEAADVPDNAYADGALADEAVQRIEAAKSNPAEPWFIAVGFLKPHLPFCAPKKYWDLYRPAEFALPKVVSAPAGAPEFAATSWGELRNYTDIPSTGPLDEPKTRHLIHGYHAAVSFMDAQLGRVLDALDASGLAKNTIVVLWGDHGWHLGDHGFWCKHTNYEQAARIPLLVVAPGAARPGGKTAALVETVDLYPTLCELAGLPPPAGLDGKSFAAVVRDPAATTKEAVFHVYPRAALMGRAVRTARHRLVEWKEIGAAAETAFCELYDYQTDPDERQNIADEQPALVAQLRAILATHPEAKPQLAANGKQKADRANKPSQDRGALFIKKDTDGNGVLSREEFLANQPDPDKAPARFVEFDADKDGLLSREEFVTGGKKRR